MHADFRHLNTAADYEGVVRNSVSGVPEHWVAEVAKQCVGTAPSPQGRRHATLVSAEQNVQCSLILQLFFVHQVVHT